MTASASRGFTSVGAVSTVLGHGSGLDDLVIFVFPVVMGIGLWLILRGKPDQDQDEEQDKPSDQG